MGTVISVTGPMAKVEHGMHSISSCGLVYVTGFFLLNGDIKVCT